MKRCLWVVMMLFVVFAPGAYADTPTFGVTQAILSLSVNIGGDNETFSFDGPGISIFGGGTALCGWCIPDTFSLTPGSSLNPSVDLVTFDNTNGTATIGGHTLDLTGGYLFSSSITALGSFTFPTNGRSSFTVSVPAGYSEQFIQGSAPSLPNYSLQILNYGTMSLNFTFVPSQNGTPAFYEFSRGQFSLVPIPDPGTLGLMVTGLSSIVLAKFRKALSFRRRAT